MTTFQFVTGLTMPNPDRLTQELFTVPAQDFLVTLVRKFRPQLQQLLIDRGERQAAIDTGSLPDFDPATSSIRDAEWQIVPLPEDLTRRRLEITGPVDRKMVINALNANVDCYMADFEDSQSPTWEGLINGQKNLRDANDNAGTNMDYRDPDSGKYYQVESNPALLIARVRGLPLPDKQILIDG